MTRFIQDQAVSVVRERDRRRIRAMAGVLYLSGVLVIGVLGYVLVKLECEPAPLLLGYVLGPLLEENLRRALLIARGDPTVFFTRPISAVFMAATVVILVVMIGPAVRGKRRGT